MKLLIFILVLTASLQVFAIENVKKTLPEYSFLTVQGRISVVLEEGSAYSAEIKTSLSQEEVDKISFISKGNQMIIKYAGISLKEIDMTIYLQVPSLESIESKQGARISMASNMRIRNPKMFLSVFAGGVISGKIDVESAEIKVDQGGEIFLVGTAKQFICSITTGGTIDALNFVASNCVAKVRMGGLISVFVKETLNASVFSGGTIRYKGNGTISEKITLGGTIEKIGK
jgi:hypothetical protein